MCGTHYARLRKFGDARAKLPITHATRKLNMEKAREIRKAYGNGVKIGKLAKKYGVWRNAILLILRCQTYKE